VDLSSNPLQSSPKRSLAATTAAAVVDAAGQRARRLGVVARESLERERLVVRVTRGAGRAGVLGRAEEAREEAREEGLGAGEAAAYDADVDFGRGDGPQDRCFPCGRGVSKG